MKYATLLGILAGFLLAVGAMWQGFLGFFLVLIFCSIGGIIGAHLEGRIDLRNAFTPPGKGRG